MAVMLTTETDDVLLALTQVLVLLAKPRPWNYVMRVVCYPPTILAGPLVTLNDLLTDALVHKTDPRQGNI